MLFRSCTATTEIYTLSLHDALPILRGVENFENFSIDRIGDFRANTANVAVQILLPSLTSIIGSYDYQWRQNGVRMGRINVSFVQAF